MIRRLRLRSSPPPPAAPENDDLLAEILLLLPPKPCSLPRAGLVCKRWRRVVTDPGFVVSFRARHRVPPLLGAFLLSGSFVPTQEPPCRAPPTLSSLDPWADHHGGGEMIRWRLLGCRHGYVLTATTTRRRIGSGFEVVTEFGVFDPMAGELWRVVTLGRRRLPPLVTAAVVAAVGPNHRSFLLVALFPNAERTGVTASVYSSESSAWMNVVVTVTTPSPAALIHYPSTLVGDALYWLLHDHGLILRFELGWQRLAVVEQPSRAQEEDAGRWSGSMIDYSRWILPAARDDHFGLAILSESSIQFWERGTELTSAAAWEPCRTVELNRLLPLIPAAKLKDRTKFKLRRVYSGATAQIPSFGTSFGHSIHYRYRVHTTTLRIIGFAEENEVIFISTNDGVFMTHVETIQFKKVPTGAEISCYIYPYSSF